MRKYLGGPEDPFPAKFHISGRFRPNYRLHHQNSKKSKKSQKSRVSWKKLIFFLMFKIDFRDRKWPENGLKGVLKWFKTQNWQLNQFSANFEKNEKIDFKNKFFSWSPAEYRFSGRISAGNRPETLSYHHTSFQKKMRRTNSTDFGFSTKKCVIPPFWPK